MGGILPAPELEAFASRAGRVASSPPAAPPRSCGPAHPTTANAITTNRTMTWIALLAFPLNGVSAPRKLPVGLPAYEVLLVDGRNKWVSGVDHVAHVEPSRLRQQLISIQPREPMLVFEPADELCVGYTGRILHRPRATDNH